MQIVVWGIGEICAQFEHELDKEANIVAYIDSYKDGEQYRGKNVYSLSKFLHMDIYFDYIIVASVFTNDIWRQCISHGVDLSTVVFLRPLENSCDVEVCYRNLDVVERIAPNYIESCIRETDRRMTIDLLNEPMLNDYPLYYWDYFRYRTFELIADQIAGLRGDVAEVGVFKGYFSRLINMKFPNDVLHMFDTFEGFDAEEASRELKNGHCDAQFIDTFKDTSLEYVMNKMPYKEKCIIRKGLFPGSARGIEAEFKFVSIDVDFEESIYESLKWFYPRMVEGGYIFVHDYNEPHLSGVRKAVLRYEEEAGKLVKVPIADKCGTLIIIK